MLPLEEFATDVGIAFAVWGLISLFIITGSVALQKFARVLHGENKKE